MDAIDLNLSTTEQIAEELSQRPNEEFIFIFRRKSSGLWAIRFNETSEPLAIIELLAAQQSRIAGYLLKEQLELEAEAEREAQEPDDETGDDFDDGN